MSLNNGTKLDEKIFSDYKDLIKKVKEIKVDLVETADEIEKMYAEVCDKIIRQDIQQNSKLFNRSFDQLCYENSEELTPACTNESKWLEIQNMKCTALKCIKMTENYFYQ